MLNEYISVIDEKIFLINNRIKSLQNNDGGFKAFKTYHADSGVWTTSEVVHIIVKTKIDSQTSEWLIDATQYIVSNQNADGGWGYRPGGKSIIDVTAWACMALLHFDNHDAIRKGIDFIISAHVQSDDIQDCGWGITHNEQVRIYSTWVASYCLLSVLKSNKLTLPQDTINHIEKALSNATSMILSRKNSDGGWGAFINEPSKCSSTASALLTLFIQGEDPNKHLDSLAYLKENTSDHLWGLETDIVVTQEKYELSQEWFTTYFCFRAIIFYTELGISTIDYIDSLFNSFLSLIDDKSNVKIAKNGQSDIFWTLPLAIDALVKYKHYILTCKSLYRDYLQDKKIKLMDQIITSLHTKIYKGFPHPICSVFSQYEQEIDYHRKFQFLLQVYEVVLKYAGIVCLAGFLSSKERSDDIAAFISGPFQKPSLGDWAHLLKLALSKSEGSRKLISPIHPEDILGKISNSLFDNYTALNLQQSLDFIVNTRNTLSGHAAIKSLYEYKLIIEEQQGFLYSFIKRMAFLSKHHSFLVLSSEIDEFGDNDKYKIRIFNGISISDNELETSIRLSEGNRDKMIRYIYFHNSQKNFIANLYPFISFMFCSSCKRQEFFFYDSIKNSKVKYISYSCGHDAICDNSQHFNSRTSYLYES